MNTLNSKINRVTLSSIIVGIDIAKFNHKARIFDARGRELTSKVISFNNTAEGFDSLISNVNKICLANSKDHVLIAVEPTGHYWFNLLYYIDSLESKLKYEMVTVNPAHTKKVNELDDNSQTKNDTKDARTVGLLVRDGRYSIPNVPKGSYANLRYYISFRERLLKTHSQLTNRLHRGIDIVFPEFINAFKDISRPTALQTLKYFPTPSAISELSVEEIVDTWREVISSGIGKKKALQLKSIAKLSIGVQEGAKPLEFEIKTIAKQLMILIEDLNTLNNLIEEELENISYTKMFLAIKGLSVVSVSSIIAEVGDLRNYASGDQLKRLAGYNLRENSSGKHKGKTTITKRGRRRLRRVLYNAVFALIRQNEAFKQLFQYYTKRKNNPLKFKQAIVALSCKLLRILHGICKTKTKFDPKEVLKGIKMNQSICNAA